MSKRKDVLWQLHTVVTGVERAGAAACCRVDWEAVPPPTIGLAVADVVRDSLIVFILYQYHLASVAHWICVNRKRMVLLRD